MTDKETLEVYNARATEYATQFCGAQTPDSQMQSFLDALPSGADVLDLGCGPGRSAAILALAGHRVIATDASEEMVRLARQHPGVTARVEPFEGLADQAAYDGIWANFSLLHAAPDDLPRLVQKIATALKAGGIFHIGMKTGTGQSRDSIGRLYTYVEEATLRDWLTENGLVPFAHWTGEARGLAGTNDPYVILQARKNG